MTKRKPTFFVEGQTYSWRRIMTGCSLIIFIAAEFGYLIAHHFDELPPSYQAINAGVFGFYFAKNILSNVKINNTPNEKP